MVRLPSIVFRRTQSAGTRVGNQRIRCTHCGIEKHQRLAQIWLKHRPTSDGICYRDDTGLTTDLRVSPKWAESTSNNQVAKGQRAEKVRTIAGRVQLAFAGEKIPATASD